MYGLADGLLCTDRYRHGMLQHNWVYIYHGRWNLCRHRNSLQFGYFWCHVSCDLRLRMDDRDRHLFRHAVWDLRQHNLVGGLSWCKRLLLVEHCILLWDTDPVQCFYGQH